MIPVGFRIPDGARSTAQGIAMASPGSRAFSASGTPAAKASISASSYSSGASVDAHQTWRSGRFRRKWSQNPVQAGFRSPGTVFAIEDRRPATDPAVLPMSRTVWLGSQKAPRRWRRSLDTGRVPSSRSSGTRSSHLPTSARSSGAEGSGAGSSTTKMPGAECLMGRPHGTGPSAIRPTERIRSGALRSSGMGLGLAGRGREAGRRWPGGALAWLSVSSHHHGRRTRRAGPASHTLARRHAWPGSRARRRASARSWWWRSRA